MTGCLCTCAQLAACLGESCARDQMHPYHRPHQSLDLDLALGPRPGQQLRALLAEKTVHTKHSQLTKQQTRTVFHFIHARARALHLHFSPIQCSGYRAHPRFRTSSSSVLAGAPLTIHEQKFFARVFSSRQAAQCWVGQVAAPAASDAPTKHPPCIQMHGLGCMTDTRWCRRVLQAATRRAAFGRQMPHRTFAC